MKLNEVLETCKHLDDIPIVLLGEVLDGNTRFSAKMYKPDTDELLGIRLADYNMLLNIVIRNGKPYDIGDLMIPHETYLDIYQILGLFPIYRDHTKKYVVCGMQDYDQPVFEEGLFEWEGDFLERLQSFVDGYLKEGIE